MGAQRNKELKANKEVEEYNEVQDDEGQMSSYNVIKKKTVVEKCPIEKSEEEPRRELIIGNSTFRK